MSPMGQPCLNQQRKDDRGTLIGPTNAYKKTCGPNLNQNSATSGLNIRIELTMNQSVVTYAFCYLHVLVGIAKPEMKVWRNRFFKVTSMVLNIAFLGPQSFSKTTWTLNPWMWSKEVEIGKEGSTKKWSRIIQWRNNVIHWKFLLYR